ncbi:hypothetical protein ACOMHN_036019 [Nucella lapillus]
MGPSLLCGLYGSDPHGVYPLPAHTHRQWLTCRNCHKLFLNRCSLQRHRKKCEGDFHLACHICHQRFYRRDLYREHLVSKHNTWVPSKKRYKDVN